MSNLAWEESFTKVQILPIIAGFFFACNVLTLRRACRGESPLAPMDFIYLLFAAFWSKILFDQWPSNQALIGMCFIAMAGITTAWREQKNAKLKRKV